MAKKVCNITVRPKFPGETIEGMMRRFKKKVEKADLMQDMRKHDYYVKPSVKRKLKSKFARQRAYREQLKREKYLNAKSDK